MKIKRGNICHISIINLLYLRLLVSFFGILCLLFRVMRVTFLTVSIILLLVAIYCVIKSFRINR